MEAKSQKLSALSAMLVCALFLMLGGVLAVGEATTTPKTCKFPAIYNFGDSNSDTGAGSAALALIHYPNGETSFRAPSGRECDGRLIIDFFAEELGLPYLNAYLDSIGTNFRHGANFAVGGSSILPLNITNSNPFHLQRQTSQYIQFKNRTTALYEKLGRESDEVSSVMKMYLPKPWEFSDALYTIDIGQNDIAYYKSYEETLKFIPLLLDRLEETVNTLYKAGAKIFWIHNVGPLGCLPIDAFYAKSKPKPSELDKSGCMKSGNKMCRGFNKQLKQRVLLFREKLSGAAFTYVDVYSAKYSLISRAKALGFEDPSDFCCGGFYGNPPPIRVLCGGPVVVNGTVLGNPCPNPSKHISWDSIHYTEAANHFVAKAIINGSLSEPKVSLRQACHSFGDG